MVISDEFAKRLAALPDEVSFGCGGLHIYAREEIEAGQIGYSISSDGESLCTGEPGAWEPNWIVIGYDIGVGDPIFVDTSAKLLPVYTAYHGEGTWEPRPIAGSIQAFIACVSEFQKLANGRGNPVELEANPVPDDEREGYLERIGSLNPPGIDVDFWAALLEY